MREERAGSAARRAIFVGGMLAGGLDIAWACVQTTAQGRQPSRMLQSIASGVLGSAAYDGGGAAMALGVLLHFTIACGAAVVYFLLGRRWPRIHRHLFVSAAAFGAGVYLFMQLVVLPLSRVPWKPGFTPLGLSLGLAAHLFCVGLPIAWAARRYAESARR